ncbi:MAG: copper resistance protein CopC [Actinomycetota bacterium]
MKRTFVAVSAIVAAALWLMSTSAHAHTGLESSTPADGATVEGPLAEVVLTFSGDASPIEDGVAVASADEATQVAASIESIAPTTIVARFDPPLPAGPYALAWQVRSADGHVIDGSFSFAVTPPPATTAPATTVPATTVITAPGTTAPADPAPVSTVPPNSAATDTTVAAPPSTAPASGTVPDRSEDESDLAAVPGAEPPPAAPTLDTGVTDNSTAADIGRMVAFPAAVVVLGLLVFAATSFAGRVADLGMLATAVRIVAALVALGAAVELFGLGSAFGSVGDALGESGGRAAVARIVGGIALTVGLGAFVARPRPTALSAAVADAELSSSATYAPSSAARWRPSAANAVGIIGAAVIALSFAFDGHTLSEGPRWLHATSSVLHVLAAAVWAGGVVALALLLWRRHRAAAPSAAAEMTLRFSVIAMVALALAAIAGIAMALMIDSDVAGYLDTDWGRLLAVKLGLVVVAVAIGAYNHFAVLPRLEAGAVDAEVIARRTLSIEAMVLVSAAVVSGLLVAASTLAT